MKIKASIIIVCVTAAFIAFGFCYVLKVRSGYVAVIKTDTYQPQSYLAVYKNFRLIYRFAPVVPGSVDYPRPLKLEKVQRVGPYLVTSWGETGADYFGTHPVIFRLGQKSCKVVTIYNQDLSDDARIKGYSWTRRDFFVTNYFDPSERVKTILTQGITVTPDKQLELSFYADEKPHASDHQYAKIKIFVLK